MLSSARSASCTSKRVLLSQTTRIAAATTAAVATPCSSSTSYSSSTLSHHFFLLNQNTNHYDYHRHCRHLSTSNTHNNTNLPYHLIVGMPALSPTMEAGTISSWKVSEGQSFIAGDSLAEIETDKATIDFEAQDDGVVAKILVKSGDGKEIKVGVPILVTVEEEDHVEAFKDFQVEQSQDNGSMSSTRSSETITVATSSTETATTPPTSKVAKEYLLMPSARHLSQSKGLDATVLQGTGKDGRITKGDVLLALKNGVQLPPLEKKSTTSAVASVATTNATTSTSPLPPTATPSTATEVNIPSITTSGSYEDIPNNNMRKVIARRLTESKSSVPHFYTTIDIELDNILSLRKTLKVKDINISVNDLIIRGSALALRDVPELNSSYNSKSKAVTMNNTVDISVAVATPGGLITPIVPKTDTLGLADISNKVKDLATRARDGKLSPEEYQGGTFCISNLGMFGISEFSAVINPPQGAILAVGGGVKKVVMNTPYVDGMGLEEQVKPSIKSVMSARLSADRRVVDEATAALFMSALKYYLSKPELLML